MSIGEKNLIGDGMLSVSALKMKSVVIPVFACIVGGFVVT